MANKDVIDIKPNNSGVLNIKPNNTSITDSTVVYSDPYNLLAGQLIPIGYITYPIAQSGTALRQ